MKTELLPHTPRGRPGPLIRLPNRRGFSLSELLLATAILLFALSGILALFINNSLLNEANRNLSIALTHAEYVIEEIRNTNFDEIKSKIIDGYWDWDSAEIAAKGLVPLIDENIDTSVADTDYHYLYLLYVKVAVTWKDRGTRDRETNLESLIVMPFNDKGT